MKRESSARRTQVVLGVGFLLFSSASCADDEGLTASDVATREAFLENYARVMCGLLRDCDLFRRGSPGPSCEAQLAVELQSEYQWNASGIEYDASAAARCLNLLSCDLERLVRLSEDNSCAEVFRGVVPINGACGDTLDCQLGLYCNQDESCAGVCAPLPAEGQACPSDECAEAFYCDAESSVCRRYAVDGAPCGDALPRCSIGLACDDNPGGTNTCRPAEQVYPAVPEGQPCHFSYQCAAGQWCDQSAPTPVCTAQRGAGEPCSSESSCRKGLYCTGSELLNSEGTCAADLALGSSCEFWPNPCGFAECINNVCAYPAALGAACSNSDECASYNCEEGVCGVEQTCLQISVSAVATSAPIAPAPSATAVPMSSAQ